jgi:hypothetical protein
MEIFASKRFLKAYSCKASIVEQRCADGAVHDFVRSYRADPANVLREYARVQGVRGRVFEFDTAGTGRMLVHFADQQMTLLELGNKAAVPRYSDNKLGTDLKNRITAPAQFWPEQPSGFFLSMPDLSIGTYGLELVPDWLYWLDEDQTQVLSDIQDSGSILSAILGYGSPPVHFIVGGPGTGKSCILLNLLKFFAEELQVRVGIQVSDRLAEYVAQATGANLVQYRKYQVLDLENVEFRYEAEVLLVDDPAYTSNIVANAELARTGEVKAVIMAFDPLQLQDDLDDERFDELVSEYGAEVHILKASYRQKENVGKATKYAADRIAASTPFLADYKIEDFRERHAYLTALANDMEFRNPHGYTKVYEAATVPDIVHEVNRINKPGLLWRHWHNLLVVEENPGTLRKECYEDLARVDTEIVSLANIESIKGLEYQHVFLFISRDLYEQVEHGFKGSGQSRYHERRRLRIPFSRAKDSLVTFVLD